MNLPPTNKSLVVSLHPAFAMRGARQFMPEIHRTMRRAVNLARAPEEAFIRRPAVHFPSVDEAEEILRATRIIAVDVETPYGQPQLIELCGFAPLDRGPVEGYVIPWNGQTIPLMREVLQSSEVAKVGHNFAYDMNAFRAYGIEPAGAIYDTIQAGALLWPPQPRSKQSAETSGIRWLSLAACVLRVLDGVAFWKRPNLPVARGLYRAAYPEFSDALHPLIYCALDSAYTGMLWLAMRELLTASGTLDLYTRVIAPAGVVLSRLETRGMLISPETQTRLIDETIDHILSLEKDVVDFANRFHQERVDAIRHETSSMEMAILGGCAEHPEYRGKTKRGKCEGCRTVYERNRPSWLALRSRLDDAKRLGPSFKAGSDDHWRWLLFEALKLKPVAVTKLSRKPQVDDASLTRLARRHPEIPILATRVKLQHARHRLSGPLALKADPTNHIHFGYSLQTATGRVQSGANREDEDKPREMAGNAQNLSDRDRRMFIAPPGHVLIQADWSQAEMRAEAWMARETAMLDAWRTGADIHSLNAIDIAKAMGRSDVTIADVRTKKMMFGGEMRSFRQAGKTLGLALIYGLGPWKMSKMFTLPISHCERIHEAFFKRWANIARFQKDLVERAESTRTLVTPFGRRLPVNDFKWSDDEGRWVLASREAVLAYPAQSVVGDMLKSVLPSADAIEGATLDTTTHDSLRFTVPLNDVERVVPLIRATMEREWPVMGEIEGYGVFVCPTDIAVGRNWGKYHAEQNPDGLKERGE